MSARFCLSIPSKISRVEKRFAEKLRSWAIARLDPVPNYSLVSLSEFARRSDVHLNLEKISLDRYHVIDFGSYFLSPDLLEAFRSWLVGIYIYGEMGILKYWSDGRKRFPPIAIGSAAENTLNIPASELPLDKIFFLPLQNQREIL